MNSYWITKQLIDFQKTTFDNFYSAFVLIQAHTEKITNTLFEQATWIPGESKRILDQWIDINKKGRDELKTAVDENFNQVYDLFTSK